MVGDGREPDEGEEDLVAVVKNLGNRGDKPKGARDYLQCSGAGGNYFRVRDLGYEPLHGFGPGEVSAQGVYMNYREASPEASGQKLGLPPIEGGDA